MSEPSAKDVAKQLREIADEVSSLHLSYESLMRTAADLLEDFSTKAEPAITAIAAISAALTAQEDKYGRAFIPTCPKCGAAEMIPHRNGCTYNDGINHG